MTTLGVGDCEALGDGWLVQPIAAWSSLAYAVVGVVLILSSATTPGRERTLRITFGFLLIATGIGSVLYHGPQPATAGFVHDITFLTALWFLAIMNPAMPYGLRPRQAWSAVIAATVTNASVLVLAPTATNALTAVAVIALIASDFLSRRVGGINGRRYATALALLAAALVFDVLGRSGTPTCTPDHLIQFHGSWHVLSAVAFGTYFIATVHPRNKEPLR